MGVEARRLADEAERLLRLYLSQKEPTEKLVVALQFPTELLGHAWPVQRLLEERCADAAGRLVVLADTNYGACCADEVQAAHLGAHVLMHFGHSCLSAVSRMPTLLVAASLSPVPFSPAAAAAALSELWAANALEASSAVPLLVFLDVSLASQSPALSAALASASGRDIIFGEAPLILLPLALSSPPPPTTGSSTDSSTTSSTPCSSSSSSAGLIDEWMELFGRRFPRSRCEEALGEGGRYGVLYVGPSGSRLEQNLGLCFGSAKEHWSYHPHQSSTWTSTSSGEAKVQASAGRELAKRYGVVGKLREAGTVGILVGTLGVGRYLEALGYLVALARRAGKRAYSFVVGQLSPAKLANFAHVDAFVLVACPENTLLDTRDYLRPVATPFEAQLAFLPGRVWTGAYSLQLSDILLHQDNPATSDPKKEGDGGDDDEEEEDMLFSLQSGTLVPRSQASSGSVMVSKKAPGTLINTPDTHLSTTRSWYGLTPQLGQTEVVDVVQGRTGIASAYDDELPPDHQCPST